MPKYQCCCASWCHSARSVANTLYLSLSFSLSLPLFSFRHTGNILGATCDTQLLYTVNYTLLIFIHIAHLIYIRGKITHSFSPLCETCTHTSVLWYQMVCLSTVRWQTEAFLYVVTMGTHHTNTCTNTHQILCHWLYKVCAGGTSPCMLNMKRFVSTITTKRQQVTMQTYILYSMFLLLCVWEFTKFTTIIHPFSTTHLNLLLYTKTITPKSVISRISAMFDLVTPMVTIKHQQVQCKGLDTLVIKNFQQFQFIPKESP